MKSTFSRLFNKATLLEHISAIFASEFYLVTSSVTTARRSEEIA